MASLPHPLNRLVDVNPIPGCSSCATVLGATAGNPAGHRSWAKAAGPVSSRNLSGFARASVGGAGQEVGQFVLATVPKRFHGHALRDGHKAARTPGLDGPMVADVEERIGRLGFLDDLRAAL